MLPGEGILSDEIRMLKREGNGVLFNAGHKDGFTGKSPYILECVMAAVRMQHVLQVEELNAKKNNSKITTAKFALFTDRQHWQYMLNSSLCKEFDPDCVYFRKYYTVFSFVKFFDDFEFPTLLYRPYYQAWPVMWLKRIIASLHSPFAITVAVDADVHACSTFPRVFDLLGSQYDIGLNIADAHYASSRGRPEAFRSDFPPSYVDFYERNLGFQLLATYKLSVLRLLSLFRDVFIRHSNDENVNIKHDQSSFREALYTIRHEIKEFTIPREDICRHETGCDDGCFLVHRHQMPDLSGKEFRKWKAKRNDALELEHEFLEGHEN